MKKKKLIRRKICNETYKILYRYIKSLSPLDNCFIIGFFLFDIEFKEPITVWYFLIGLVWFYKPVLTTESTGDCDDLQKIDR